MVRNTHEIDRPYFKKTNSDKKLFSKSSNNLAKFPLLEDNLHQIKQIVELDAMGSNIFFQTDNAIYSQKNNEDPVDLLQGNADVKPIEMVRVKSNDYKETGLHSIFAVLYDKEEQNDVVREFKYNRVTSQSKENLYKSQNKKILALEICSKTFMQNQNSGQYNQERPWNPKKLIILNDSLELITLDLKEDEDHEHAQVTHKLPHLRGLSKSLTEVYNQSSQFLRRNCLSEGQITLKGQIYFFDG